jgi:RHS repeat-associated protein
MTRRLTMTSAPRVSGLWPRVALLAAAPGATTTDSAPGAASWSFARPTATPAPRTASTAGMIVVPGSGMDVVQRYEYSGRELASESNEYYFRYRAYGPALGQFCTWDPIGYTDGMGLYSGWMAVLVTIDPYGRGLFDVLFGGSPDCCAGVKYDRATQCCCNGVLQNRAAVKTGVKYCENAIYPWLGYSSIDHAWIEYGGHTYELNPTGSVFWGTTSFDIDSLEAKYKENWATLDCKETVLSPCEYDVAEFLRRMDLILAAEKAKYGAGPQRQYSILPLVGWNCQSWARDVIGGAKFGAQRREGECR